MKILITGFEPFCGAEFNSSREIALATSHRVFPGAEIKASILPVSFHNVPSIIENIFGNEAPDILVMLGQAASSSTIRLERIAVNLMDASKADNDGFCPDEEKLIIGGPEAFFCPLHLKELKNELVSARFPVRISDTAGTFVCNAAYYHALYHNTFAVKTAELLLIHLPLIGSEQACVDGRCYLPRTLMEEAVARIIEFLLKDLKRTYEDTMR